ncbi:MAG TPA: hypothetical protein VG816_06975 [Solirubrobacterales bacterium]|nr:hypothetical protein [Solirubrobacterales bacterium]
MAIACALLLAGSSAAAGAIEGLEEEPICVGDSCQPLPAEPEDPTPATLTPNPGNPPLHVYEPKEKKKHPKKRRHGRKGRHGKHGGSRRPAR